MKTKTLLIAAVMFFGLTAAAFAQATYTVGSIPVTQVISTGVTERTGDITFTQVTGSGTSFEPNGTITVTYGGTPGVPITAPDAQITVTGTGSYSGVGNVPTVIAVNHTAGVVTISVPGGKGAPGSFTLTGVRVSVAGSGLTTLTASISATGNAITAGQTIVTVINNISAGIQAPTSTAAVINATSGSPASQTATIKIKEGFLNAFGDPAIATNAGVQLTLSAAPPKGVVIDFPLTAATNGAGSPVFTLINPTTGVQLTSDVQFTSTSTSLVVAYKATTTTDSTKQETLTITPTITSDSSAETLPLSATSIQFTVSLAPIGPAFGTDNAVLDSPIPRYADLELGPAPLVVIQGSTTTILIPFAQTVTAAGYNTGFAIANTTEDPGSATGFDSPVPQTGVITFYFFPQNAAGGMAATNFSYTTSASSPGTGLDATGKLPAGSTYTVLLSQLLSAAAAPADFSGYMFVVTNFTNAHCLFVVSNFTTFSQGALGLIIGGDRTNTPEQLNN